MHFVVMGITASGVPPVGLQKAVESKPYTHHRGDLNEVSQHGEYGHSLTA